MSLLARPTSGLTFHGGIGSIGLELDFLGVGPLDGPVAFDPVLPAGGSDRRVSQRLLGAVVIAELDARAVVRLRGPHGAPRCSFGADPSSSQFIGCPRPCLPVRYS